MCIRDSIYTAAERERLEAAYDKTLGAVNENEVIKAKVHQITGGDAVLDINFKSDGLVSMSCLLYTSPSPRDRTRSRMPSSA